MQQPSGPNGNAEPNPLSAEAATAALSQLHTILATRGLENLRRFTDDLVWATAAAQQGSQEAKAVLEQYLTAVKRAEFAARGIVLPG